MAETDPNVEGFPECVHLREHTSENRAGIAFHRSWTPAYGNRPEDRERRYIPEARLTAALARVEALEAALTPSANTKAAYIGEFSFRIEEENRSRLVTVPWDNIKEIMAAIRARALLDGGPDDA